MATYNSNSHRGYTLRVVTTPGTQNASGNYTPVSYVAYLISTNYSFSGIAQSGHININGTRVWTAPSTTMSMGYNSTLTLVSGTINVGHNVYGSGSFTIVAEYSNNSGGYGPVGLAISATETLTSINRVGYISSYESYFTINSGFNITAKARSNGLTYQVGIYNSTGTTALVSYRTISAGSSVSYSLSAAEQNTLYNYLTSASGTSVRIYLRTMSGSTVVGAVYVNSSARPKAVAYTIPSSFTLGSAFNVTITPNASVLYHTTGIAVSNSWISGYPVTVAAGTTVRTLTTSTDAQKKAIMAIDTSKNSFSTVQVYTRQYNANGVELGLLVKTITANVPNINASAAIERQIVKAINTVTLSGNITTIDHLAYSLNGGSFITLSTNPGDSYEHKLSGLNPSTQYTMQFRIKQSGTNYYYYSSTATFTTLANSTLAVSPSMLYVDDELSMTTTKATGVTNRLSIKRLIDDINIYSNSNAPSGTIKRTLTDADFEDGASFDGQEYLSIRVTLDAYVGSEFQTSQYTDVIVYPNGVMYVRDGSTWKRYYAQVRDANTYKRAIPHIRVSNAWQKAKS